MLNEASNFAPRVDTAFIIILSVSLFFLVAVMGVMLYFTYKYNKKRNPVATQIHGNTKLEAVWTIIPILLVLAMFYFGWTGYTPEVNPPADAMKIETTARMWHWSFKYGNGKIEDTLYVPLNKPVVLNLTAMDVIHSLFIPAFRIKKDLIPGRTGQMWFIATKEGRYNLFCSSYCGLKHSYMETEVVVMPEKEYNKWALDTSVKVTFGTTGKPTMPGENIMRTQGCFACHSVDGSKIVGPTFKGFYGTEIEVVTAGAERKLTANDDYVRKSIYEPAADIVKGYPNALMVSYKSTISEDQIKQIIEYLKTLNAKK